MTKNWTHEPSPISEPSAHAQWEHDRHKAAEAARKAAEAAELRKLAAALWGKK